MHGSGITADDALKAEFAGFEGDEKAFSLKVEIKNDNFVSGGRISSAGDLDKDFEALQASLVEKTPCYTILRVPGQQKFVVCFFVPDNSPVRQKMVYASSTGALKAGLGGAKFTDDWAVATIAECTRAEYETSIADQTHLVRSGDERMNAETAYEVSAMLDEEKVSAIVGVPIKISDPVLEALKAIKAGEKQTTVLILDAKTETLNCEPPTDAKIADLDFPEKEPRYFVHNFKHTKDGEEKTKLVFVYYCPGRSPPKLKMFYSTVKSNIVTVFKNMDITDFLNFECNEKAECTEELLMTEIYPPVVQSKAFKKPTARGGRSKARPTKFQG